MALYNVNVFGVYRVTQALGQQATWEWVQNKVRVFGV